MAVFVATNQSDDFVASTANLFVYLFVAANTTMELNNGSRRCPHLPGIPLVGPSCPRAAQTRAARFSNSLKYINSIVSVSSFYPSFLYTTRHDMSRCGHPSISMALVVSVISRPPGKELLLGRRPNRRACIPPAATTGAGAAAAAKWWVLVFGADFIVRLFESPSTAIEVGAVVVIGGGCDRF